MISSSCFTNSHGRLSGPPMTSRDDVLALFLGRTCRRFAGHDRSVAAATGETGPRMRRTKEVLPEALPLALLSCVLDVFLQHCHYRSCLCV